MMKEIETELLKSQVVKTVDSVVGKRKSLPYPIEEYYSEVYATLKVWLPYSVNYGFPMPTEEICPKEGMKPVFTLAIRKIKDNLEELGLNREEEVLATKYLKYLEEHIQC